MENKTFWKTMEGELTVAFIVILAAFGVIMAGIGCGNKSVAVAGLFFVIMAIMYSPLRVFVFKKKD
nr:hypothetical protein [uncultured Desulfobacter sp.]